MTAQLEFYYDYSSPYGYLASERIEAIVARHNRTIIWRPVLLGAVFKVTGGEPLIQTPLKGEYSMMDFARSAREHNLDYRHPSAFPIASVAASRATLWLRNNEDAELAAKTGALVHALYRAYFFHSRDITSVDTIAEEATGLGIDGAALKSGLADQNVKDALRDEVEHANRKGVFGSPTMIVDGEKFWGHDRLEQLDRWLETGAW